MKRIILLCLIFNLLAGIDSAYAMPKLFTSKSKPVSMTNYSVLRDQAIENYQLGKYKETIKLLNNLEEAALTPEDYLIIANSYESIGNIRAASESLTKSIERNPKYSNAYYNLGLLYCKSHSYKAAIENLEKAVKYDKTSASAFYNLGCCYLAISDYKSAKNNFLKAITQDETLVDGYYNLGLSYEGLNQPKNAKKYFDIYKKLKVGSDSPRD